jgi:hypothetical protein
MPIRRTAAVLAATAATVVLLTGCAGIGGQSKLQACADLSKAAQKASQGLSSAFSQAQSDPTAAHAAVVKFDDQFKAAVAKVSNPAVKKPAQKAADALDTMASAMNDYKAGNDPAALEKAATNVEDAFSTIGKVCSKP